MDILIWALKVLLAGLIIMPIVGACGCAWINHWWKKDLESRTKWMEFQMKIAEKVRREKMKGSSSPHKNG